MTYYGTSDIACTERDTYITGCYQTVLSQCHWLESRLSAYGWVGWGSRGNTSTKTRNCCGRWNKEERGTLRSENGQMYVCHVVRSWAEMALKRGVFTLFWPLLYTKNSWRLAVAVYRGFYMGYIGKTIRTLPKAGGKRGWRPIGRRPIGSWL